MALRHYHSTATKPTVLRRRHSTESSGDRRDGTPKEVTTTQFRKPPAEQFAGLASKFSRRLLVGIGSASAVAVGANFAGITSFILGFSPETGRNLRVDVVYPIEGFSRCFQPNEGYEFIYPATWVGDQILLYRAAGRAEEERSLDPPPPRLNKKKNVTEPAVAFGPPGSRGDLNVSVIVSLVPLDFRIEAFGGPKEVGEQVVQIITGLIRRSDIKATLIGSTLREDPLRNVNYYELEFTVESPTFHRHNVAVCTTRGGRLFTLNALAPESSWPEIKQDFYKMASSFTLV